MNESRGRFASKCRVARAPHGVTSPQKRLLAFHLLLVALGVGPVAGCRVEPEQPKEPTTLLDVDFRTSKLEVAKLNPSFPGAFDLFRSQPDGLRIFLPDEGIKHRETGVIVPFGLRGDFEVSVGYEVINVGPGWGASVEIYVVTNAPTKEALGFNRVMDPDGSGSYFVTRLTTSAEGKRVDVAGDFRRTTAIQPVGSSGHLRLARAGPTAVLSACDAGNEFRELFHVPLGIDDVTRLRVGVNPRRVKSAEVRLLDLRITGTSLANGEAVGPRRVWLWILAGLFTLAAFAGALWSWWVRRRGTKASRQHDADTSSPQDQPGAEPTASP